MTEEGGLTLAPEVRGPVQMDPAEVGAAVDVAGTLVVECCNSTWLIDPRARRFRRVLKGLELGALEASTGWRDYDTLEIDEASDALVVYLNRAHTRVIRSPRHHRNCGRCRDDTIQELSSEHLRELTRV